MQYKSILLAFVASSLVTAAPVPEDADAALSLDTFAMSPELAPLFVNTSLLVPPTGNTPAVLLPDFQSTNPGHTWPLVKCDPLKGYPLLKGFSCTPGLLEPYGYDPEVSIVTWDTNKIKIGKRCHKRDNKKLPPTWVCMKPDGTNKKWLRGSHLQRGLWRGLDCHHNRWTCLVHWGSNKMEVIDENGIEWDERSW